MRAVVPALGWLVLAGCSEAPVPPCGDFDEVYAWVDADGDGFGSEEAVGWVCGLSAGQIDNRADCDDTLESVRPDTEESCDGLDNDCNGRVDDGLAFVPWYPDGDGDGYGVTADNVIACGSPGDGYLRTGGDCDDGSVDVNPVAIEVCNGDVDDDCDGLPDDEDSGVDPVSQTRYYADQDGDGFGDSEVFVDLCVPPSGVQVSLVNGDCEDTRELVNPGQTELCNRRDDDCDGLLDDNDPTIDPDDQTSFFADRDGDGFGDPTARTLACEPSAGIGVPNDLDCDDADVDANLVLDWFLDGDGDGAGDEVPAVTTCYDPGDGFVLGDDGVDCAPSDPSVFPLALEVCGDGTDQDCSGYDRTCSTWLYTIDDVTDTLERIDADTLVREVIGPLGVSFGRGDLAYDPVSRTLYMVDGATSLYTVDLVTGVATLVGQHGVSDLFGLALDTSTGTLYGGRNTFSSELYTLNPATGTSTLVGFGLTTIDSLLYDEGRDQLVSVETGGAGNLYSVDRSNGSVTLLGGAGNLLSGGATWESNNDAYWVIDSSLYRYDPKDPTQRRRVSTGLGRHAGLAFVPDPPN